MDTMVLTATQDCPVKATPKDRKGNVAQVENESYVSGDETVATLIDNPLVPGGKMVHAVGPTGATNVTYTGDADLGAGVKPLIGSFAVIVNAGEAVVVDFEAGAPVEQAA